MIHKSRIVVLAALACLAPVVALAQRQDAPSSNGSSTIAAGGVFQTALTSEFDRKGCLIQNPTTASEALYVNIGSASPTTANSFSLAAGASFSCNAPGIVITDTIQVEATTTGHAFVMVSQ